MVVAVQPMVRMRNVWTIEDVQALDVEDWRRYEIVDGSLVVSPSPGREHEFLIADLRRAIEAQVSAELTTVGNLGIELSRSYRIPDLVVLPRSARHGETAQLSPDEVLLVVEVVSPGSETTDRITKPAQYAAAGIGAFWRVETDPVSLTAYTLPAGAGTYTEVGTWGAGETARIDSPFPVAIELASLSPPG